MKKIGIIKQLAKILSPIYPMAKRWLYQFHGGVFPKYNKELSLRQPLRQGYMPKQLILPLQQHMGLPALPTIKVGDNVKKYQLIAQAAKGLSAPIHAPTSGTIIAIEPRVLPHASGLAEPCIVIEPDGQDSALHNVLNVSEPPKNPAEFKTLILEAGIVGMGGAGFPTFAKLPDQPGLVKYLIINGAECEPFITCDDMLMQTHPDEIIRGAQRVAEIFAIPNVTCAIESNKPQAIKSMQQACQNTQIKIEEVATVYPMGGQKQLIQEVLGIEVPSGQHTIDIGIVMMNIATLRAIAHAVDHGQPLVSRFVTVSGLGLQQPYNMDALLGTPFDELVELAKPKQPIDYPLIMGGPMMGVKLADNHVPLVKTTNCILANPPEPVQAAMACIRCGECAEACPINLQPQQLYWHTQAHEYQQAEKLNLFDCIECGCCSFVCPSHIPLVQYYRHAKSEVREIKAQAKLTEQAKQRHEARLARIERDKQEREAKLAAKKAAVKADAAKDAQSKTDEKPIASDAPKLSAREKAIQMAKVRQQAANKPKPSEAQTTSKHTAQASPDQAVEDKRKAAMEAAKARAAAKKAQVETPADQPKKLDETPERSVEDKRKAAMEAAKARAAAKKAQQESKE
ncbi:electron transport complex subunit RsxC [Thiomicrospira microaerophila]|nr:electron transport complex subunit RsxC [Thiomicrospira microaerophila]